MKQNQPLSVGSYLVFMLIAASSGPWVAAQTPAGGLAEGQKIEIREGDSWSPGAIVKKEGRKFLVHYEGAEATSDEWVAVDRIRIPGAAGVGAMAPSTKPSVPPVAKVAAPAAFQVGDKIEFKWGGMWRKGSVFNKRGKWYFIQYDETADWKEWVEPWRLRKRGSTEDNAPYASPNGMAKKGEGPPREDPGELPVANFTHHEVQQQQANKTADAVTPPTPINVTALREIVIGQGENAPLAPDGEAPPARPLATQSLVLAGAAGTFFEEATMLAFSGTATPVVLVSHLEAPPGKEAVLRLSRVNLATGQLQNALKMPVVADVLDLSADGKQMLAHSRGEGFGLADRLEIWDVDGPAPKHAITFKPFDSLQGHDRDIIWARFVGKDQVATLNWLGRFIVWDLTGKAVWATKLENAATPAVSPGKKYLAVSVGSITAVLDAQSGKTLKTVQSTLPHGANLSFRPDGKQLALAARDTLLVVDLDTGNVVQEGSPIGAMGTSIEWGAQGYLILDGRLIFDLTQNLVVWQLESAGRPTANTAKMIAGRYYYVAEGGHRGTAKPALASDVLPNEKMRTVLKGIKFADEFAVHPGASMSIEVSLPDPLGEKTMTALKNGLTNNGVIVAEGQPLKVTATTEQGQSREISYRTMGAPRFGPFAGGETKMDVNEVIQKLTIVDADGKKLWERVSLITPPFFLNLKKDQDISAAVSEAMEPKAGFFTQTMLPKFVPKARETAGYGTSHLTPQGLITKP
jgi:hypothetical protein